MSDNPFSVSIHPSGLCGNSPPEAALYRDGVQLFTRTRSTLSEALQAIRAAATEYIEPYRLTLAWFAIDAIIATLPGDETNA